MEGLKLGLSMAPSSLKTAGRRAYAVKLVRRLNLSLTFVKLPPRAHIANRTTLPYSKIGSYMATLTKGVDFASDRADGAVYALSDGMPIQLKRMCAPGARGPDRADYDGMDQHGADLDSVSRSN
jgi:hypothetical protein